MEAKAALLRVAPASEAEALRLDDFIEKAKVKRTSGQEAIQELTDEGKLQPIGEGVKGNPRRWFAPRFILPELVSLKAAEGNARAKPRASKSAARRVSLGVGRTQQDGRRGERPCET